MNRKETREDGWTYENFYFGNASYPSDATYRTKNNITQKQIEHTIELNAENLTGSTEHVQKFLQQYEDTQFKVIDSYETNPAYGETRKIPPRLYLLGWYTLTTPEELTRYKHDQNDSM